MKMWITAGCAIIKWIGCSFSNKFNNVEEHIEKKLKAQLKKMIHT
jgi:hypothetical protein